MQGHLHVWPNVAILTLDEDLPADRAAMLREQIMGLLSGDRIGVFGFPVEVTTHQEPFPVRPDGSAT